MAFASRAFATSLIAVGLNKVEWEASGVGALYPSVVRLSEELSRQNVVSGDADASLGCADGEVGNGGFVDD